jgi:hypothetical protein
MESSILYNLLNYRLRHYVITTSDAIKRQWHLAFLVVGVFYANWDFSPMAFSLSRMAAMANPSGSDAVVLCVYQLAILLWVLLQRKTLLGGDIGNYLKTLPIPWMVQRNIEFVLVIVVTNLLWLPFFIGMTFTFYETLPLANKTVCLFNLALLMLLQVLSTIRFIVNREPTIVLPLVASVYLFFASKTTILQLYGLTPALFLVAAILLYFLPLSTRPYSFLRVPSIVEKLYSPHSHLLLLKPYLAIQCHIIFVKGRVFTAARIIASVFFIYLAWYSIHIKQATELGAYLLLIFSIFSSLALSGLYAKLDREHQHAKEFLSTLPMSNQYWVIRDLFFVGITSICITFPFLLSSLFFSYIKVPQLLVVIAFFIGSGVLFRYLAIVNQRFSMLFLWLAASALMACGTWVLKGLN